MKARYDGYRTCRLCGKDYKRNGSCRCRHPLGRPKTGKSNRQEKRLPATDAELEALSVKALTGQPLFTRRND